MVMVGKVWSSTYHSCPCFLNTSALDPSFWQAIPERQLLLQGPVQRTPHYINEPAAGFLEIKGSKVAAFFFLPIFLSSTCLSRTLQKNTDEGRG